MPKPQIQVVSIAGAQSSTKNNDLLIGVVDGSRIVRSLNLTEQAQEQLIQCLLASPPFPASGGDSLPRKILRAHNVRVVEMPGKQLCLEVRLGDQIALHILLPGILPEALLQLLQAMIQSPPVDKAH